MTDHDSVSGFPELLRESQAAGLPARCGIEINTLGAGNVHILGYGLRWSDEAFRRRLEEFRQRRVERIRRIVESLRRLGLPIAFEDVAAQSHEAVGRPHVADALRKKGIVHSRQEAFNRFLAKGKPGYVDSMGPTPEEAISLIREAGGFPSLAHPDTVAGLEESAARWKELGLEGLEAYYSSHTPSDIVRYRALADRLGLLCTGGTDFHGPGSGRDKALGVDLPDDVYERFARRLSLCS